MRTTNHRGRRLAWAALSVNRMVLEFREKHLRDNLRYVPSQVERGTGPFYTVDDIPEILRIAGVQRAREDRQKVTDHYWSGDSAYGYCGSAMRRCRDALRARRDAARARSKRSERAALTRKSPNGVRLIVEIQNWDRDRYSRPGHVNRIFSTAAAADKFLDRYTDTIEGCDYTVTMEPA